MVQSNGRLVWAEGDDEKRIEEYLKGDLINGNDPHETALRMMPRLLAEKAMYTYDSKSSYPLALPAVVSTSTTLKNSSRTHSLWIPPTLTSICWLWRNCTSPNSAGMKSSTFSAFSPRSIP